MSVLTNILHAQLRLSQLGLLELYGMYRFLKTVRRVRSLSGFFSLNPRFLELLHRGDSLSSWEILIFELAYDVGLLIVVYFEKRIGFGQIIVLEVQLYYSCSVFQKTFNLVWLFYRPIINQPKFMAHLISDLLNGQIIFVFLLSIPRVHVWRPLRAQLVPMDLTLFL